jgi:2-phosphosulfolactate phosphatase
MHEAYLRVHKLPQHVAAPELAGSVAVVIDVLRATSTICQALASGAREVVPFLEPEDAIAAWAYGNRDEIALGGERQGLRIDGFDLGNSPSEYTPAAVGGRRIFFTTTNGTRAMNHARQAKRVILGSFLNLSAVVASLKDEPFIDILCAGTDGAETGEDILTAGGIVSGLCRDASAAHWKLNDAAAQAKEDWSQLVAKVERIGCKLDELLAAAMRDTPGGRNLIEVGLEWDLETCAQIDRLNVVPQLDVRQWRITVAHDG